MYFQEKSPNLVELSFSLPDRDGQKTSRVVPNTPSPGLKVVMYSCTICRSYLRHQEHMKDFQNFFLCSNLRRCIYYLYPDLQNEW